MTEKKQAAKAKKLNAILKKTVIEARQTDGKLQQIMVINLGYELKGDIRNGEAGEVFVEGELNTPKWKQASDVSSEIAALLEQVNQLKKGSIKKLQRMAALGNDRLLAQVTLMMPEGGKVDKNNAREVAKKFVEKTSTQAILPWESDSSDENSGQLDERTLEHINESANSFLKAHGGQSIRAGMEIQIDGEEVVTMKGVWKELEDNKLKEHLKQQLVGAYDGRRLRQRCFYLVEATKKAKISEIFYDDNEFDEPLRALADNKNSALKVSCLIVPMGKTTRLVLDQMTVMKDQDFF